jgi:hypothetical protein
MTHLARSFRFELLAYGYLSKSGCRAPAKLIEIIYLFNETEVSAGVRLGAGLGQVGGGGRIQPLGWPISARVKSRAGLFSAGAAGAC